MIAEIITVGTEILLGNIINTNAAYLSRRCADLGLVLYHQETVGDNMDRLCEVIGQAMNRSDIIILSGGLGPTEDDITRDAVAKVLNEEMTIDTEIKKSLVDYFKSINRDMTDSNLRQAMRLKDSIMLNNQNGTAPGMIVERENNVFILLPGPPVELEPMFENEVAKYIKSRHNSIIFSKMFKLCNASESIVEERLKDLIDVQKNPTIATYAKVGEVSIRVSAYAESENIAKELLIPVENVIRKRFKAQIFTDNEADTMESVIIDILRKHDKTLALAESCTGGMVASSIVACSGASDVLISGLVTYSNRAKIELLGVKPEKLEKYGAVSEQIAVDMVEGLIRNTGANCGIAITGIAGPNGGTKEKPVGLVYISSYYKGDLKVRKYSFKGDRNRVRLGASKYALTQLYLQIKDVEYNSCKALQ